MKTGVAVAVALICLFLASTAHAHVEPFDSGNAGWSESLINSAGYSWAAAPTFSASGGNPGGFISGTAGNVDSRLYSFDAPAYASGNLSGQTLTVDIKTGGTVTAASGQAMARFYIGYDSSDYFITTNAYSLNLNSAGGGWTTFLVPVTASDFMAWPGQTGTMSFATVAADPAWIGLVFTSSDYSASNSGTSLLGLTSTNGAVVMIDNFGPVRPQVPTPLPAAFLLFAPGLAAVCAIRRKLKQ